MKFKYAFTVLLYLCYTGVSGQTNMHFSSDQLSDLFSGNYAPDEYPMQTDYGTPEDLVSFIHEQVAADSLKSYLIEMEQFHTRNSGSDTLSPMNGIGAARNWMLGKFNQFSSRVNSRLITGFFEFDYDICGMMHHKSVVSMLPGTDPGGGVIIIQAHLDSRCSSVCDTSCLAQGMEDNGSGVALVLEIARVLSTYNYNNTLVFVGTTGEEQGLDGARAMADYATQRGIQIKMVQNNDIVGGIICGETSSPPSCPGEGAIDSTQVRLFSYGGYDSPNKSICRYIKLEYDEMLRNTVPVPMMLTIMSAEDRTGRGGDHIPFRENGYPAMRFTSANEHGDASNDANYHDRQHTSDDILGVDTDGDQVIDSFFVDFNYLARNTEINAVGAVMAAISPLMPEISAFYFDAHTFYIEVQSAVAYPEYRIGLRTDFNDFDTIYSIKGGNSGFFDTKNAEFFIFLSAMAVDSNGVESLPSREVKALFSGTHDVNADDQNVFLLQNRPNPFDESTIIAYNVSAPMQYGRAGIVIRDLSGGVVQRIPTQPQVGINEVLYHHGYHASGIYIYSLEVDGKVLDERKMVFAN